ncbi:DUF742 domain-containing protein [Streptomyces sp. NPDC051561]|uniref:DUF742 domain-containing protein n=1 Tax=Streptomyces sp. NPDC051561 TaxID=3365658 RepID=UPI0037A3456B
MIEHQRAAEGSTQWYDAEAGPLVRPYARTGVRADKSGTGAGAAPVAGPRLDLVTLVSATADAGEPDAELLGHVHHTLLGLCRTGTRTVADLASSSDLPIGVVRALVEDLARAGLVTCDVASHPAGLPAELPVQELIDGLRAL